MNKQMQALILEALEHERGGIRVYQLAADCMQDENLRDQFGQQLEQTRRHEEILLDVCRELDLDPEAETPGRPLVRNTGAALARAIVKARDSGDAEAAELVACESVVLVETADHADWKLLTQIVSGLRH